MNDLDLTDQEAQELRAWLKERYDEWRYEGPTIDEERPGLRRAIRKIAKHLKEKAR